MAKKKMTAEEFKKYAAEKFKKFASKSVEATIEELPLEVFQASSVQPRKSEITESSVEDLMNSIEQNGQLEPIIYWERPNDDGTTSKEILSGHRRFYALTCLANEFPQREWKVRASKVMARNESEAHELAVFPNILRENLNPLDEAEAILRIIKDYEIENQVMAAFLGKKPNIISWMERVNKLSPECKKMVREHLDDKDIRWSRRNLGLAGMKESPEEQMAEIMKIINSSKATDSVETQYRKSNEHRANMMFSIIQDDEKTAEINLSDAEKEAQRKLKTALEEYAAVFGLKLTVPDTSSKKSAKTSKKSAK